MANWRRDNDDDAEITSLSESFTNILTRYGGRMTTNGNQSNNWSFRNGANNMSYIHANSVANFSVQGQLSMSKLAPRCNYKGVFELELTNQARGWQGTFEVSLTVPGSRRTIESFSYPSGRLRAGAFTLSSDTFQLAAPQRTASLGFTLSHTGPYIRNGLIVQRFVIQQA